MTTLTTYRDLIDHVLDYFGTDGGGEALRFARRAVQGAYLALANHRRWSYYTTRGRLVSMAPFGDGTVEYRHAGGPLPRMLILTPPYWPTWAPFGVVRIGQVAFEVDRLVSPSVVTLTAASNPGADLPAGTSYQLVRDTYPLPPDFVAADEFLNVGNQAVLAYQHPRDWLGHQRIVATPATPRVYTFRSDPNFLGVMAVSFYPPPDHVYAFDYLYQRRGRPLVVEEYAAGTASTTAGSDAVTGSGTAWTGQLVGSVLNLAADSRAKPTGLGGASPFFAQRVVADVQSATVLVADAPLANTLTGVKYALSDPVDVEAGAMSTLLLRECEKQARALRRMKPTPEELLEYERTLHLAFEADSRTYAPRAAGGHGVARRRLAHMPAGPDVS